MKTPFDVSVLRSGDIVSLRAMLVMFGRAFHESATNTFVAVAALYGGASSAEPQRTFCPSSSKLGQSCTYTTSPLMRTIAGKV